MCADKTLKKSHFFLSFVDPGKKSYIDKRKATDKLTFYLVIIKHNFQGAVFRIREYLYIEPDGLAMFK